jgi:hypothetical protein
VSRRLCLEERRIVFSAQNRQDGRPSQHSIFPGSEALEIFHWKSGTDTPMVEDEHVGIARGETVALNPLSVGHQAVGLFKQTPICFLSDFFDTWMGGWVLGIGFWAKDVRE